MKDQNVKRASAFHKGLFRLTRGAIGKRLVDNDMMLLTTKGRISGLDHTVPLLYLNEDDRFIVIASYGGRDSHPDWYLNLASNSEVLVEIPGSKVTMLARTADPAERQYWWPKVKDAYDGYAAYQERTKREIPIVFLEPSS